MSIRSVYIVNSHLIPICKYPFTYQNEFRPIFANIFENEKCFVGMRKAIFDFYRTHYHEVFNPAEVENYDDDFEQRTINPITDAPFIKETGQVCFNTRSLLFVKNAYEKPQFIYSLAKNKKYWNSDSSSDANYDFQDKVFGYDPSLEDQRMNFLCFELRPPLVITAYTKENFKAASGKIFVHFYPSGYIVIHVAISLKIDKKTDLNLIKANIDNELHSSRNSDWSWKSKFGAMALKDTVLKVMEQVYASVFTKTSFSNGLQNWNTALSIVSDIDKEQIIKEFNISNYETFASARKSNKQHIIASKKGMIVFNDPTRTRNRVLNAFWKIMVINEFILLKTQTYNDLADHLKKEIINLKDIRLNSKNNENNSVFNKKIPLYLLALDGFILNVGSYYRSIYSVLSKNTKMNKQRIELKNLLTAWELELDKSSMQKKNEIINLIIRLNGNLSLFENISHLDIKKLHISSSMNNHFENSTISNTNFVEGVLQNWQTDEMSYSRNDIEILNLINKHAKTDKHKQELIAYVKKIKSEESPRKKQNLFKKLEGFFDDNPLKFKNFVYKSAFLNFFGRHGYNY